MTDEQKKPAGPTTGPTIQAVTRNGGPDGDVGPDEAPAAAAEDASPTVGDETPLQPHDDEGPAAVLEAGEPDDPSSFHTSSWPVQPVLPPEESYPAPAQRERPAQPAHRVQPAHHAHREQQGQQPPEDNPRTTVPPEDGHDAGANQPGTRRNQDAGPESAAALTPDRLLTQRGRPPAGGWRRWLYSATFGYLNPGDSEKVRVLHALEHTIAARLGDRTRYIPVLSRKGGVGKTTVTTLLGMTLANIREDRVIAMDANPDRGTLSDRSPGSANYTARQLVHDRFAVDSFAKLSNYVARDGSRLDVLASDTDPTVAQAFDEIDYRAVTEILGRFYSIVLTDSGTGMVHSVMNGTLEKADTVILVSGGSVDEARLASETLSWLEAHDRSDLVAKAIVVINMSSGGGSIVDVDQIEEHFNSRVRTVVKIPYDRHLAEGSRINLAELRPATRTASVELAALVVNELHT